MQSALLDCYLWRQEHRAWGCSTHPSVEEAEAEDLKYWRSLYYAARLVLHNPNRMQDSLQNVSFITHRACYET